MARLLCSVAGLLFVASVISAKSVTYPGIGTFNSHDFFDAKHRPFTDLFVPQSPQHIDPEFDLYTRGTQANGERLKWNNTESAQSSHYDPKKPTKVVVHGFIDNQLFADWMKKLKDKYLDYEDVNVMLVFWPKGNFFPYGQACVNTRVVGAMVAIQIQTLIKTKGGSTSLFHVIGHSLGSHIAGNCGKFLQEHGPGKLGRITGLDPAGPFFEGLVPAARLWHTDADYVDSIHTDARPLLEVGFGMYETCSHVDIYPNGGRLQPGCDEERITGSIFHGLAEGARRLVACNHQRAVDYYIDSLDKNSPLPKAFLCHDFDAFKAGKCVDCGDNGEKCAILGPRDIEYKNSVKDINQGVDGVNGKRFFMITGQHEPLLSKYQYVINLHMAAHGLGKLEQFDKVAKVHIKFVDNQGHEEEYKFNDQSKMEAIFKIGQSYTHPGVLSMDPENLKRIDFEWDHGVLDHLDFLHLFKMHIDKIEVIGLTSHSATTRTKPMVKSFCNHSNGIQSRKHVSFDSC